MLFEFLPGWTLRVFWACSLEVSKQTTTTRSDEYRETTFRELSCSAELFSRAASRPLPSVDRLCGGVSNIVGLGTK